MASIGPGQHQEGEGCQKGFQEEDSIERRGAEGICPASEWHWTLQGETQKRVRLQNLGGSTMISWRMETCNHRIWNEAQSSCMEIGMAWNSQQQPAQQVCYLLLTFLFLRVFGKTNQLLHGPFLDFSGGNLLVQSHKIVAYFDSSCLAVSKEGGVHQDGLVPFVATLRTYIYGHIYIWFIYIYDRKYHICVFMVPTVVPWGNKDMKADPDLKDMEARLSAFEKRSWVPRMPEWICLP